MAYVEGGTIREKRPLLRISTFVYFVLQIWRFITDFFRTMFSLDAANDYGKKRTDGTSSRWGGGPGGGGPGGPGRGPYGGPNVRGMSNVRGINHNAPAPCGSCCGR